VTVSLVAASEKRISPDTRLAFPPEESDQVCEGKSAGYSYGRDIVTLPEEMERNREHKL